MAATAARFAVAPETLDRLGAAMQPIDGDNIFNMVRDSKVVLIGESRRVREPHARIIRSDDACCPQPRDGRVLPCAPCIA